MKPKFPIPARFTRSGSTEQLRAVDPDWPEPLPQRSPGEALAEAEHKVAELREVQDALEGAEMYQGERAQLYERKSIELGAKLAAAVAERDDLSARSLPMLPGTVYEEKPVRALFFDELIERLDFDPTGFVGGA